MAFLLIEARMEVKPATALVYNNMWTGKTRCFLPGTNFLIPGIHRKFKEVSLRNEAQNPSNVELFTGDGIGIQVDYIIRKLQVGYPEMKSLDDKTLTKKDQDSLKESVIKATTNIDYDERKDKILTRVVAKLQERIEERTANDLFEPEENKEENTDNSPPKKPDAEKARKKNKAEKNNLENQVNEDLRKDQVTTEWGFLVEMDLEDFNLPKIISAAREEHSAAKIAGEAIAEKAKEAGVHPSIVIITDALKSLFNKKE